MQVPLSPRVVEAPLSRLSDMKRTLLVAALWLLPSLLPSNVSAWRPPTGEEHAELQAAADRSREVPPQSRPISDVHIATNGPWAMATIHAIVAPGQVQQAVGLFEQRNEPYWRVRAVKSEVCVGRYTSRLGMSRSVGRNLGLRTCTRPPSPEAPRRVVLGDRSFAGPYGDGFGSARPPRIYNGGVPSGLVVKIRWRRWGARSSYGWGKTSIYKPRGGYYRHRVRIRLRVTTRAIAALEARSPTGVFSLGSLASRVVAWDRGDCGAGPGRFARILMRGQPRRRSTAGSALEVLTGRAACIPAGCSRTRGARASRGAICR